MQGRRSLEECANGEGIEFVREEPYNENGETGSYQLKIYHYASRIPGVFRWAIPKSLTDFHEEAWTSFPHDLRRYHIPGLGERFALDIDTYFYPYTTPEEIAPNPCHLNDEELQKREIMYIDILNQPPLPTRDDWKLHGYENPDAGILKLPENRDAFDPKNPPAWTRSYTGPLVCISRCIKAKFDVWGVQTKAEEFLAIAGIPNVLLESARGMIGWSNEWSPMSFEESLSYAAEINQRVNDMIKNPKKK